MYRASITNDIDWKVGRGALEKLIHADRGEVGVGQKLIG